MLNRLHMRMISCSNDQCFIDTGVIKTNCNRVVKSYEFCKSFLRIRRMVAFEKKLVIKDEIRIFLSINYHDQFFRLKIKNFE